MTMLALCLALLVPAHAAANLVEPLSNGLALTMTGPELKKKFGEPTYKTYDARTFGYESFTVNVGGRRQEIWHLTLKKGVTMSSGIGIGSSRAEVEKVFGSAVEATAGRYALKFSYSGDKLSQIKIDPGADFGETAAKTDGAPSGSGLLGGWHGAGSTLGRITLNADGTYASPNGGRGTWKQEGDEVLFSGPLAAWNGGRGKLTKPDLIEFKWRSPSLGKQYFVFSKDK